jgi:hypothetical protein
MSQRVKTKRQANFKDFKRFRAFRGLLEQKKNVVFNSFVCKLGFFFVGHSSTHAKKNYNLVRKKEIRIKRDIVKRILLMPFE